MGDAYSGVSAWAIRRRRVSPSAAATGMGVSR